MFQLSHPYVTTGKSIALSMHCFFFFHFLSSFLHYCIYLSNLPAVMQADSASGATDAAVNETEWLLPSCCLVVIVTMLLLGRKVPWGQGIFLPCSVIPVLLCSFLLRVMTFLAGWVWNVSAVIWTSLVAQTLKNLPVMQETWVQSLGWENPWRREWQPTPVFLPGKPRGERSLAGYSPWDCRASWSRLASCVTLHRWCSYTVPQSPYLKSEGKSQHPAIPLVSYCCYNKTPQT